MGIECIYLKYYRSLITSYLLLRGRLVPAGERHGPRDGGVPDALQLLAGAAEGPLRGHADARARARAVDQRARALPRDAARAAAHARALAGRARLAARRARLAARRRRHTDIDCSVTI